MFNYHELTINEPRGSPAKRKQFIVICCVVSFVCGNALINAGGFNAVRIGQGKFTGGEFVYKTMERDYAAFVGLSRTVGQDAEIPEADHENAVYSVFLDVDPAAGIPGGSERFMTGVLNGKDVKQKLVAFNTGVEEQPPGAYAGDFNEGDKFGAHIYYEVDSLPSVDAAVCQFVFTGGFMSPLIYEYKVFPAMIKYAKKLLPEDSPIVIASTCSTKEKMCTHYIPLQKADKFYLGKRPGSKDYAATIDVSAKTDFFAAVKATMRVLGFGGKKTNTEEL